MRGTPNDRLSDDYRRLLDQAFQALYDQSEWFRDTLAATEAAPLAHSFGKDHPCETILMPEEFTSRLERLRHTGKVGAAD